MYKLICEHTISLHNNNGYMILSYNKRDKSIITINIEMFNKIRLLKNIVKVVYLVNDESCVLKYKYFIKKVTR